MRIRCRHKTYLQKQAKVKPTARWQHLINRPLLFQVPPQWQQPAGVMTLDETYTPAEASVRTSAIGLDGKYMAWSAYACTPPPPWQRRLPQHSSHTKQTPPARLP